MQLRNINFGGIAPSGFQGNVNQVADMKGLDVHSRPGVIMLNRKLQQDIDSGVTYGDVLVALPNNS